MFIKERNVLTQTQLNQISDKAKPTFYHVKKHFGNWDNLRYQAFGIKKIFKVKPNPITVLKAIAEYRINTLDEYLAYRQKEPTLFPSRRQIDNLFGCWTNAKRLSLAFDNESILLRYMLLKKKLHKYPNRSDCRKHGIEIDHIDAPLKHIKEFCNMIENPYRFIKRVTHGRAKAVG